MGGGGGSQPRTRLPPKFPVMQGLNREFSPEAGLLAPSAPHKARKSLCIMRNSLFNGTGNFQG
jgi:hypothetical protein